MRRSRLTVFFRLPLATVHIVWLLLWSVLVVPAALGGWLIAIVRGRLPTPLHRFNAAYVRYTIHVYGFLSLVGNPFPGFVGAEGSYPIDVTIAPPARQSRWKTGFRAILVIPALMLAGSLGGSVQLGGRYGITLGLLIAIALLGWFVALALARLPRGFHDGMALALGYWAQTLAYVVLLTDRYPNADPDALVGAERPAGRGLAFSRLDEDGRRNRLAVLFRLILVLPHLVVLYLWSALVLLLVVIDWFALLFTGRAPEPFQRMVAAFVRYSLHVFAYLMLITGQYPSFGGGGDRRYTVDVMFGPNERQNRWKVGFRLFLALPSEALASAYGNVLFIVAFLGWFAALVTGGMPTGMRKLGLASLEYVTQAYAYLFLLTDQYPYTGPVVPSLVEPSLPADQPAVGS